MFPHHPSLRLSLIERLFRIAAAQGRIPREKEQLLADIAYLLELSPAQYLELHTRYQRPADAADVLGIASTPEGAALGKRYRELMQRWHPDRFASEQRSPEIDLLLQLKSAEINEAYRALRRQAA